MPDYRGLTVPKYSFGNLNSDCLFGKLDQEVFDFYKRNRLRYRRALDIGANIGVHSMLMSRLGWQVRAFEPDQEHCRQASRNAALNDSNYILSGVAVSDRAGTSTFVRVSNNSTGSHLEGAKCSYGPVERFEVMTVDCRPLFAWADFAKIDCEGHEATILECVTNKNCEFMVEIGGLQNAERIYGHFKKLGMGMWSQKTGWGIVEGLGDMPCHHTQGHLFIGNHNP